MSYLESLFSLENRTAVVIGGTGVLCGSMAQTMARAGAEVVLVGRSEEKAKQHLDAIAGKGGSAYFVSAANLLLASQAGSFITGAEIIVDGGFAAMAI